MTVSDSQLVELLLNKSVEVRSAALELLTSSYSNDTSILPAIFSAWDEFGADQAFPEFPLIGHLPIGEATIVEALSRAQSMSSGRKLTDRACRCAGKMLEAISIASPSLFTTHMEAIEALKESSKIFFRVSLQSMRLSPTAPPLST